jgi:alkyl hydroperoxide reductase subunit AhpF
MALLTEEVTADLRSAFAQLENPVRLAVFSQALADPVSEEVRRLVEELAALDPRLTAEPRNFVLDQARVDELGIERIPAIAVLGEQTDYGVRLYGLPTGYEFGSLVDSILDVSRGTSGLAEATRSALAQLERDVRVRVFSTPT